MGKNSKGISTCPTSDWKNRHECEKSHFRDNLTRVTYCNAEMLVILMRPVAGVRHFGAFCFAKNPNISTV